MHFYISEDKSTISFFGTYQYRKINYRPTGVLRGSGDNGDIMDIDGIWKKMFISLIHKLYDDENVCSSPSEADEQLDWGYSYLNFDLAQSSTPDVHHQLSSTTEGEELQHLPHPR